MATIPCVPLRRSGERSMRRSRNRPASRSTLARSAPGCPREHTVWRIRGNTQVSPIILNQVKPSNRRGENLVRFVVFFGSAAFPERQLPHSEALERRIGRSDGPRSARVLIPPPLSFHVHRHGAVAGHQCGVRAQKRCAAWRVKSISAPYAKISPILGIFFCTKSYLLAELLTLFAHFCIQAPRG